MSTTTQPPDITAHLDAAERAAATLTAELQAALAMVPDGEAFSALRFRLVEHIAIAARAGNSTNERSILAEIVRPKGPMVEITVPTTRGKNGSSTAELEAITAGAFVMRGGDRYSRKNGDRINHRDAYRGAPYITEAERARVLALPRPPAAARPPAASKEPRK